MAEYRITPIDRLNQVEQVQPVRRRDAGSQFGSMLQREIASASQERESFSVAFSKHARARAEERGIEVTDTLMDQLADSVERASAKGATNILAFDATRAFIINIPHGRVITTMSQEEMQENIFTNIDGAVLLK
ncbi:MAG: flagellar biosynthesis protein [Oscillospiraceae bacterium]|jgi:flagellar operon protein|nr:flagellar biosynthesis protein [Oscillospiraceae bacterium]MDE6901068.1 flagellar biosynthesis protein [Oscillospiraceae bacterium]